MAIDLIEDKTKNRFIFTAATMLAYIYLTWSLYLSGSSVAIQSKEIVLDLSGPN